MRNKIKKGLEGLELLEEKRTSSSVIVPAVSLLSPRRHDTGAGGKWYALECTVRALLELLNS